MVVENLFCNEMVQDSFTLVRNVSTPNLNICEILYDDPSQSDDLEFIEVYNIDSSSASLGGLVLSGVVQAVFPDITLPSGGRIVCAKNGNLVTQAFGPFGQVFDWNSGTLPSGSAFANFEYEQYRA